MKRNLIMYATGAVLAFSWLVLGLPARAQIHPGSQVLVKKQAPISAKSQVAPHADSKVKRTKAMSTEASKPIKFTPPPQGSAMLTDDVRVRGKVLDQGRRPVSGATVVLGEGGLSTITATNGAFDFTLTSKAISRLPAGPVKVFFTYPGSAPRHVEVATSPGDLQHYTTIEITVTPTEVQVVRTQLVRSQVALMMKNEEPTFEWPPPQPSTKYVLPPIFFAGVTRLSDANTRLVRALEKARYFDRAYFRIPDGFAVATQLEATTADATPLPERDRWPTTKRPGFRLEEFLRNLVVPRSGHFRVLVFTITSDLFAPKLEKTSQEKAKGWLTMGLNDLPPAIGQLPWGPDYRCTVLIYEYIKEEAQPVRWVESSSVTGRMHLVNTGLITR